MSRTTDPKSSHYSLNAPLESAQAVDVLRASMTPEEYRGWLVGCLLTQLLRYGKKDARLREAEKISVYADWLRESEEDGS